MAPTDHPSTALTQRSLLLIASALLLLATGWSPVHAGEVGILSQEAQLETLGRYTCPASEPVEDGDLVQRTELGPYEIASNAGLNSECGGGSGDASLDVRYGDNSIRAKATLLGGGGGSGGYGSASTSYSLRFRLTEPTLTHFGIGVGGESDGESYGLCCTVGLRHANGPTVWHELYPDFEDVLPAGDYIIDIHAHAWSADGMAAIDCGFVVDFEGVSIGTEDLSFSAWKARHR